MNTNPSPQKGDFDKKRTLLEVIQETKHPEIQESIHPHQHEINITDGSEFLDDGIRMKDQPLEKTVAKENE
jgi:hypothetical protein